MTPSKILDSGSRAHVTHHSGMHPQKHEDTITVKRTWIDNSGKESHYMLQTTDGQTFEADNSWVMGQFSIDKQWGNVETNGTYHIKYIGWDAHNIAMDYYYIVYDIQPAKKL